MQSTIPVLIPGWLTVYLTNRDATTRRVPGIVLLRGSSGPIRSSSGMASQNRLAVPMPHVYKRSTRSTEKLHLYSVQQMNLLCLILLLCG